MIIRNNIGLNGKSVMEYVPETEEDREEIFRMMLDGEIPMAPSQRDQAREMAIDDD